MSNSMIGKSGNMVNLPSVNRMLPMQLILPNLNFRLGKKIQIPEVCIHQCRSLKLRPPLGSRSVFPIQPE